MHFYKVKSDIYLFHNKQMRIIITLVLIALAATASKRPNPVQIAAISSIYDKPWYSGYLDINNNSTHMHYFYFPSQSATPQNDPLLFWFNGGPGCSSLLGALYEHGPFLINDAFGTIMNNPYGWNKQANTVYIESPAQVGFSYMDGKAPTWNDEIVAKLNLNAVLEFLETYPEFKDREIYVSGESYAGIYVPTLFYQLHLYNLNAQVKLNLKGFAVGNGCTDPLECQFQNDYPVFLMQLYRDLGFISSDLYNSVELLCRDKKDLPKDCTDLMDKIENMQNGINIYDAFRPCYQNNAGSNGIAYNASELRRLALRKKKHRSDKLTWAPPCVDSLGIDGLLLDKDNRKALGIPDQALPYSMCNADDNFDYVRSLTGSYWIYQKLVPLNKYKITIYSGDSDPAVPYPGTIFWMNKLRNELQLSTEVYWRPWFTTTTNGKQNSGSIWGLSNKLQLVTFKGIGHMAPQWNYEGGFKMINNLLHEAQL